MSEVFHGYEPQYCEISASPSRMCIISIRKMDLEARSLQPSIKAGLSTKLREYKSDLNNLKSELKRITNSNPNQAAREELLEFKGCRKRATHACVFNGLLCLWNIKLRGYTEIYTFATAIFSFALHASPEQRSRLLTSIERFNHSIERIKEGRRTVLETEELGVSILQDLHQQRQSLRSAVHNMFLC
ncbi:hypothetical protein ZIOFF_012922 [Zingiber officinale]|uniref:Vesicle transport v-SNARE N-terminal domain-containing protein n=1 Tax=Zingiber officinale TaxID=94328 RepID=A0A8J5HPS4_ZINOF|nr:hypothetical protein ZIOFF_012922 [Zingiber officinale]